MTEIKFKRNTTFIGRNGQFKQSGLLVNDVTTSIALYPITSKDQTGRSCITIPKENLLEVITALCIEFKKYNDEQK
jgi:hypothetical protein